MSLPNSVAFIPDGNARWAKENQKSIQEGHYYGLENLRRVLNYCRTLGIHCVSMYGFSIENWTRPDQERSEFFETTLVFLQKYYEEIIQEETKFVAIGELDPLPGKLQEIIQKLVEKSQNHKKHILQAYINYGSRQEIVRSCNRWIQSQLEKNKEIGAMSVSDFENCLYTNCGNDPDLLIRTGGTKRLSNFLLYQLSYTELYFCNDLWPDFDEKSLDKALAEFKIRTRNFGGRM